MPPQQYVVHPADLPYVPTIMRAPSPSSTIGTDYGQDDTGFVEAELSEYDFGRMCEEMAGINRPRSEEEEANRDPLVHPRPLRQKFTPDEERDMFEQVMVNLRAAVNQLEEEELFEQTMVKDASVILDDPMPSSENLDDILRSVMNVSTTTRANTTGTATVFDSARFTNRSETVTPQLGANTASILAGLRNANAGPSSTPTMEWHPGP